MREAFALRGVSVSAWLIRNLRSGGTTPTRTAYRLECAARLRANDAALKTECCLRLLSLALELRRPNPAPPRVYACRGMTPAMEAALGWTHLQLSQVVRVMRADLALWSTHTWDDALVARFRDAASLFLRVHHRLDRRHLHGNNDLVNVAWDQHTIHGFYFALYHVARTRMRATWFPYELDLLLAFYARQQDLGNPLTPLDRQVLAGSVSLRPTATRLSHMVKAHVGVDYGEDCVTRHRHLLVTGSPKPVRERGVSVAGAQCQVAT